MQHGGAAVSTLAWASFLYAWSLHVLHVVVWVSCGCPHFSRHQNTLTYIRLILWCPWPRHRLRSGVSPWALCVGCPLLLRMQITSFTTLYIVIIRDKDSPFPLWQKWVNKMHKTCSTDSWVASWPFYNPCYEPDVIGASSHTILCAT